MFRIVRSLEDITWRKGRRPGDPRIPRNWIRDSIEVDTRQPYDAFWFTGAMYIHGVTPVSQGTRSVLAIGRLCPKLDDMD